VGGKCRLLAFDAGGDHRGLVCAAEFARDRKEKIAADFLLDYADWLSSHLEAWMVTDRGELVKGKPRHYVRITPAIPQASRWNG
jgi:glucoamylase